jgi:hypothetical protein
MANSHDRRKMRQAGLLRTPESNSKPISISHSSTPTGKDGNPLLFSSAKLLRRIIAGGVVAILIVSIHKYLDLAGVTESMTAARAVLVLGCLVVFIGVLVIELEWEKSRKKIIYIAIVAASVLTAESWALDSWTVRYRIAHAPPILVPSTVAFAAPQLPAQMEARLVLHTKLRTTAAASQSKCSNPTAIFIGAQISGGLVWNDGACSEYIGTKIDNKGGISVLNTPPIDPEKVLAQIAQQQKANQKHTSNDPAPKPIN